MADFDIIIIGAGIAGASAGFELAQDHGVLLLEMETHPGYHATGRSAALYTEIYGNAVIRKLAKFSRPFLENPPAGFSEFPLLKQRGGLFLARSDQKESLQNELEHIAATGGKVEVLDEGEMVSLFPALKAGYATAGIYDAQSLDIDVDGLHKGFLRLMKQKGGKLQTSSKVEALAPFQEGWRVKTEKEEFSCRILINAAGAWAGKIGQQAGAKDIGLVPMRRTAFLFEPPQGFETESWPMVIDIDEKFYLKPDSGKLLGSPADQTPVPPQDARPQDWDIAVAVERMQAVLGFEIRHIRHKWAGLRSFVADKTPVVGFDPHVKNFFWLAGQGGYGIKTSPALAACCASLIRDGTLPESMQAVGLTKDLLSPKRLNP